MKAAAISLAVALAGLTVGCSSSTTGGATTGGGGSSVGAGTSGGGDGGFVVCVQPAALDFGNVQVLGPPATKSLTINNCGGYPVDLTFPGIDGPQVNDFETNANPTTLGPGEALTFTVGFAPTLVEPETAGLPFGICPACPIQTIRLSGVGVDGQLTFSPNPVNFGTPAAGSMVTISVTGTNTGSESLMLTSLTTQVFPLSNLTASGVAIALPLTTGIPLAPMASFTVDVTLTSDNTAGYADQLIGVFTVADASVAPQSSVDQILSTPLPPCSISYAPASLNFGPVAPLTMATQELSITNVGDVACQVSGVGLDAGSDPAFAVGPSQAAAFTVQPGSSQEISVTFSPTAGGPPQFRSGELTFQTTDPSNATVWVPLYADLGGVCPYGGGDWPRWHLDNFNSGQSSADTSALQGKVGWTFALGKPDGGETYVNSPVVFTPCTGFPTNPSYVIYELGMRGALHALDSSGTEILTQTLTSPAADPQPATPAILADGSLFIAEAGNGPNLYYLNDVDAVTFSEPFGASGFASTPTFGPDGTLFLADANSGNALCGGVNGGPDGGDPFSALAFGLDGGGVVPLAGLTLPVQTTPSQFGVAVADDDTSYWAASGQFFALSPPDAGFSQLAAWPACGIELASDDLGAVSNLALDMNNTGNLYAYSAWETAVPDGGYTVQGNIAALDPATGAEIWIFDLPSASLPVGWKPLRSDVGNASPAVALDGTVYVGNGNGLYALDGTTGAENWLFPSANVSSAPAIGGDGTIFFGCDDGMFYAVTPTGTLRFSVQTGGPISSSPAIAPDGTVVFVSDDGNLYAIN